MIHRAITPEARHALSQFRALCLTGPRQSGKTTLSRYLFKGKPYLNYEDPVTHARFLDDPHGFMKSCAGGAVLDEVQRVPDVFRHLQILLDKDRRRGQFILTGSNNFLLQERVAQTLAGRAGYLTLLPMSYQELRDGGIPVDDLLHNIRCGGYPEIRTEKLNPNTWLGSYVQTYVQRDVRQIKNIANLALFSRFVRICANYAGQILNRDEMARQVGVDTKTVLSWLGLLENSYILFQLTPWHSNLNKRIIKSPKLYFHDTGLLCSLLNITSREGLKAHPMCGAIFENWCIAEIRKNRCNRGLYDDMFYLRDSTGNEIDLIVEKETGPLAIEIKSAKKTDSHLFQGLKFFKKYQSGAQTLLLYQGKSVTEEAHGHACLCWNEIDLV